MYTGVYKPGSWGYHTANSLSPTALLLTFASSHESSRVDKAFNRLIFCAIATPLEMNHEGHDW